MKKWALWTLIIAASSFMACTGEPATMNPSVDVPPQTATAPPPAATAEPTPSAAARCDVAPQELVSQIERGLTVAGDVSLERVHVVDNNDDRPWRFIGASIYAPGMDGVVAVWATASLDLDKEPLLVAADTIADEFSVWGFPAGGERFASKFDDEIQTAELCAET